MKKVMKDNRREEGIDVLRVIAIALVILHHIDITNLFYHNTDNVGTFLVSLFVTVIVSIDVPIFFTISGYLLIQKEESIKNIYEKRIYKMIIILILFSFAQYSLQIIRTESARWSLLEFFIKLIQGDIQETYWFLYAYIGFLIVLPILRKLFINITLDDYKYLLVLLFVMGLLKMLSGLTGITVNSGLNLFVSHLSSYMFYILSGYIIKKNRQIILCKRVYRFTIVGILMGVFVPMCTVAFSYFTGNGYADWGRSLFCEFLTISVFIFIIYSSSKKSVFNSLLVLRLSRIGKYVFMMYLVEQISRYILLTVYIYLINHTIGIIAAFVYWMTSFMLSLILSIGISNLPGIRRLI